MLRALLRAAGWGALAAFAALIAGRVAQRGGLPVPDAILAVPALRWAEVGGIGAGLAVLAWALLRLLPEFTARAVQGGFWTGLGAMAILHQGATFLLFHLFHAVPAPGYSLAPMPQFGGMPELVALLLAGALAGVVLALLVQWSPLFWVPGTDLLLGLGFGALALSQLSPWLPLPPFSTVAPGWWANLMVNGTWGLGVALMLRPLELNGSE